VDARCRRKRALSTDRYESAPIDEYKPRASRARFPHKPRHSLQQPQSQPQQPCRAWRVKQRCPLAATVVPFSSSAGSPCSAAAAAAVAARTIQHPHGAAQTPAERRSEGKQRRSTRPSGYRLSVARVGSFALRSLFWPRASFVRFPGRWAAGLLPARIGNGPFHEADTHHTHRTRERGYCSAGWCHLHRCLAFAGPMPGQLLRAALVLRCFSFATPDGQNEPTGGPGAVAAADERATNANDRRTKTHDNTHPVRFVSCTKLSWSARTVRQGATGVAGRDAEEAEPHTEGCTASCGFGPSASRPQQPQQFLAILLLRNHGLPGSSVRQHRRAQSTAGPTVTRPRPLQQQFPRHQVLALRNGGIGLLGCR
jgi:hypothetical protein